MEEAGRRDSAREMTRRRWRGGGEGGKGQIRRMGDTEGTFGERWDVEGCGDQNGKMCCGNSLEKFFFFFLRAGGKGGSQKSLGVSISSWLSVKGQGFTGFDQQCQLEDNYSQEVLNLWLQQQCLLKKAQSPKVFTSSLGFQCLLY